MAFALYATVAVPEFTNGERKPDWEYLYHHACRVRVDDYATRGLAQRAAERLKLVWLDATRAVPASNVRVLEIIEEP